MCKYKISLSPLPFASASEQCKEIEENNRMGKTSNLLKKIGDTKGTFHTHMREEQ